MTYRTVELSTFAAYVESEYVEPLAPELLEIRELELAERLARLSQFPYAVVLKSSYPELDFANRWCWQNFGSTRGECHESSSEYPSCAIALAHCHVGCWMWHWLVKTEYDFGFCEWYFADRSQYDQFLANVPHLHWGEKYPKSLSITESQTAPG